MEKWDSISLKYFFIWVPALVLQPIITAYIPIVMIDSISKGFSLQKMTLIVAFLSFLLTMTIWIDSFMKELIKGGARTVRMAMLL